MLSGSSLIWAREASSKPGEPVFEVLPADLVARAEALRERALTESRAFDFLDALTTEVGPRLAGSTNDRRAVEWARRMLEDLGFSNVRAEEVTVPRWTRGEATGEITAPSRQRVELVALGGSVGTPAGGIEAEVVEVAGLEELAQLERSRLSGKIVFINRRMRRTRDGSGYGETSPIRRYGPARAAALGAAAVLIRSLSTSNQHLAHTGSTHYQEGVPRIPAAALSNPDADLLAARIRSGETVRFGLELGCRHLGDTTSANVIGEIPGRERPEEVVLLAAHLDSWDLGTGAIDDGAGCAIITEAARLIGELEPVPRRTVRVWLAAGEENGLSGALAYAERHADELGHHVAAMESDFGAARVWAMRSRVARRARPVARDLARLLAPLGIEYQGNEGEGGFDLLPLRRHRVPFIDLPQDGTYYFDAYHSAADTLDKVDPGDLAQNVAAYAVAALVAADIEGDLGRAPKFRGRLPPPFDEIAQAPQDVKMMKQVALSGGHR
ncbi:MAG: M28 family peptidase [bacterium]|nr:M28 family peptidase [bacterium]